MVACFAWGSGVDDALVSKRTAVAEGYFVRMAGNSEHAVARRYCPGAWLGDITVMAALLVRFDSLARDEVGVPLS